MEKFFIEIHHKEKANEGYYRNGLNDIKSIINLSDMLVAEKGHCLLSESYSFKDLGPLLKHEAIEQPVIGNLFFVENNSVHQLSHYLSRTAFRSFDEGAKLVINFDQHIDYGGDGIRPNNCGLWGYIPNIDYLRIGKLGRDIKRELFYRADSGVCAFIESTADSSISTSTGRSDNEKHVLIKDNIKLRNIIDRYDYIYVTVDMDVLDQNTKSIVISEDEIADLESHKKDKFDTYIKYLLNNVRRTNWRNSGICMDTLLGLFDVLLPKNKIIAADITGFPPEYMNVDLMQFNALGTFKITEFFEKYDRKDGETLLNSYINDINTVAGKLTTLIKSI